MVMFCDLVGSTELSGRHDPERYGLFVRRYVAEVRTTIEDRFGGDVVKVEGDGLLALFGAPHAHGDDAERAVRAAMEAVESVRALSAETERESGEALSVRVAVHRGHIYRDEDDTVYGLAANVAARLQTLAGPNEVLVSEEVQRMVSHVFETEALEPQLLKGLAEPVCPYLVVAERSERSRRRSGEVDMVGRAQESDRLTATWNDLRTGTIDHAVSVVIQGDAGVGKTRLARTIAVLAAQDGAPVVEIAGSAFYEEVGLYPIRRVIERNSDIRRHTDPPGRLECLRAELDRRGLPVETYVPWLAPILSLDPAAGYEADPVDARRLNEQIAEAAYEYLERCIGEAASLLVVDDAQWIDSSTRDLLASLGRRKSPCLILMTARPEFHPPERAEIVELTPLSESDSGRLVDVLCADTPIGADLRLEVVTRSDGIPLYIEELVASASRGADYVPGGGEQRSAAVPDLLYDLLAARLHTSSNVIPVATASAVIGREVDRGLLHRVLDFPVSELDDALETLCAQRVLERRPRTATQFRFRHELLREVAYELEPPSRRRYVHGKVAEALLADHLHGDVVDWDLVASHFEEAGRAWEAADAHEQAADSARLRGASEEARGHLSRAIDLLVSDVDPSLDRDVREVKLRLQRGYIAVYEEGHASSNAAADYERCLELTAADPFGDEMFKTVIVLWAYRLTRGELAKAREISEFTFRTLARREWYRNFNLAAFGILDCWEGDLRAARDLLELFSATRVNADEERFLGEWLFPNEPVTVVLTCLGIVRYVTGDLEGADAAFESALGRALDLSFPQGPISAAYALSVEVWLRTEREQFVEAEHLIAQILEIAARHGFNEWTVVAMTQQTVVSALRSLGTGADARDLAHKASALSGMIGIWRHNDTLFFLPYYLMIAGVIYAGAGDRHNAKVAFEESLTMARETGMNFWRSETLRHLAGLELDPTGVEEGLRQALQTARTQHALLFELRAALDLEAAAPPGSRHEIERLISGLASCSSYPEVARAEAVLAASR
jgi:class 3 adenylate cyclase/tetratricopeptide (TPR) repeat protein